MEREGEEGARRRRGGVRHEGKQKLVRLMAPTGESVDSL